MVKSHAESLLPLVTGRITKASPDPGYKCSKCAYRVEGERSGFRECFGDLADVRPFLFDLYQLNAVRGQNGKLADELIRQKKASLFDVSLAALRGAYGIRQRIQIEGTRAQAEYRSPDLARVVNEARYPLHFIDFETSRVALPYHRGMRPFEQIAFQWSSHTVHAPGAEPVHQEWINLEPGLPNFEFARSLRDAIGSDGTILTWSHHERTVLRDIREQMVVFGENDLELARWLDYCGRRHRARSSTMWQVTLDHYFHPEMAGKTSIKMVLPAVWRNNSRLHAIPWFKPYFRTDCRWGDESLCHPATP